MKSSDRYITCDKLTGEIVATSKHHPMLQPLVRKRSRRYRLPFSRTERDLVLSVGLVAGLVLAMAI